MHGSKGETDVKNRFMDMDGAGKEGKGGVYGKSNMETYITIHKIANGNSLYDSGNSDTGAL